MTDISPAPAGRAWRPKANPWLIAVVVALAAFMEVLDTSIANVALPYMAGSLGATPDQSTWVLTSYLVSNAIVLPISGWFVGLFGRKRFFLICLSIFTVSSVLCGTAPNLATMIAFRVLQGAGGGGLQPMAQAILADTFPPQQTRARLRALRRHGRRRADPRTDAGRLDDRQLHLALDLPHQRAGRPHDVVSRVSAGRRPALGKASHGRRNTDRLRGHGAARPRRRGAADHARQGTGEGLVLLAVHRDARGARRRRSRVARRSGSGSTRIRSSTCTCSGTSTSSAPTR